jgi:phage gpG-like protein
MTELSIQISVDDLRRIQANFEAIATRVKKGEPIARVGLVILRQAIINASGRPGPMVQTARLRSSITLELASTEPITQGVVGTNVKYAPPVEFGHAQQVGRFVPIYAMRRITKGTLAGRYEVSRGLGVRLVKPFAPAYPFMLPALEQTQASGQLDGVLASFGTDIERDWGS